MALGTFCRVVIPTLISQIVASYAQFIQYAGAPYPIPAFITNYPSQSYSPSPVPAYAKPYNQPASNYQPKTNGQPYQPAAIPVGVPASYTQTASSYSTAHAPVPANTPSIPVYQPTAYQTSTHQRPIKATSVSPLSAPDHPKHEPIIPCPFIPKETSPLPNLALPKDLMTSSGFSSNILNNLAIALQLLIVSNLIHNPPPEPKVSITPQVLDEDLIPAISPLPIAYIPPSTPETPNFSNQYIPNANFLGTSNFGDTGISKSMMSAYGAPTLPAARPNRLMSPYDAIGSNSPYIDIFQSKSEPKSPYHLSSDYKDLFSLTELFKI